MNRIDKHDDDIIHGLLNYAEVDDYYIGDFQVDKLTSKRIKNNIKKKLNSNKRKRKYTAAVLLLISLSTVTIANPTLASNIQNSIIQRIQIFRGDYANYKKYTKNVNLSSYDKGIKFIINEVVSDNNKIVISYSIISDKNLNEIVKIPYPNIIEFKINGKRLSGIGYGASGEFTNEKRYDGVLELDTMRENIPNTFYLGINIKSIDRLEGSWQFNIKVNKKDIQEETKSYQINKNINLKKDKIFIKRISISPISTAIEVNGPLEKYQYFLFDDKGNEIKLRGASSKGLNGEIHYNKLINTKTRYLTFLPFEFNDNYVPNPQTYDMNKLPLELPQGNLGKLTVTNIRWDGNTLKVSYTVEGKIPITQSEELFLFDENGKIIESENMFNTQNDPLNQHEFIMYFKGVSSDKKYKIGTMALEDFYKIDESLKFTVELK